MSAKSTPPPADLHATPCCACAGPHRLVDCDDPRGVDRLVSAGLLMSADRVRQRVRAKEVETILSDLVRDGLVEVVP